MLAPSADSQAWRSFDVACIRGQLCTYVAYQAVCTKQSTLHNGCDPGCNKGAQSVVQICRPCIQPRGGASGSPPRCSRSEVALSGTVRFTALLRKGTQRVTKPKRINHKNQVECFANVLQDVRVLVRYFSVEIQMGGHRHSLLVRPASLGVSFRSCRRSSPWKRLCQVHTSTMLQLQQAYFCENLS